MPPSSSFHSWRTWPMICDTTTSSKSILRTELILQTHSIKGKIRTFMSLLFHHVNVTSWSLRPEVYLSICLAQYELFSSTTTCQIISRINLCVYTSWCFRPGIYRLKRTSWQQELRMWFCLRQLLFLNCIYQLEMIKELTQKSTISKFREL